MSQNLIFRRRCPGAPLLYFRSTRARSPPKYLHRSSAACRRTLPAWRSGRRNVSSTAPRRSATSVLSCPCPRNLKSPKISVTSGCLFFTYATCSLTGGSTLCPAARESEKTCKITILCQNAPEGSRKRAKSRTLCFYKRLDVVLGEKGYEDSGLGGFPASDGTRISAQFTAAPLAAPAAGCSQKIQKIPRETMRF